jgi:hypothetical protein
MGKKIIAPSLGLLAIFCLAGNAGAETTNLKTTTGNEVGLTVSYYVYREPEISLSLKGTKLGIDYNGSLALHNDWFLRGDLRFAIGEADYSSSPSGNKNGNTDWYYEVRGLVGKDFQVRNHGYSPYIGLGYRYLFNDLRGLTSNGSAGYRRESNYFYLPVGVTHRLQLRPHARLVSTVEYDYLLRGRQESQLSDIGGGQFFAGASDVTNKQTRGYGLRLGVMYEMSRWSAGPYLTYWRISQSDDADTFLVHNGVTIAVPVFEPRNNTVEAGVKASYKF